MKRISSESILGLFLAILSIIIVLVLIQSCTPKVFEATEFKGHETEILREINLYKKPQGTDFITHVYEKTPVTMTGYLYGEKRKLHCLEAEIILEDGTRGWVPLISLKIPLELFIDN